MGGFFWRKDEFKKVRGNWIYIQGAYIKDNMWNLEEIETQPTQHCWENVMSYLVYCFVLPVIDYL